MNHFCGVSEALVGKRVSLVGNGLTAGEMDHGLEDRTQAVRLRQQRFQFLLEFTDLGGLRQHHRSHEPGGERTLSTLLAVRHHLGQQGPDLRLRADQRGDELADREHRIDVRLRERTRLRGSQQQGADGVVVVGQRNRRPGTSSPLLVHRAHARGQARVHHRVLDQLGTSLSGGASLQAAALGYHEADRRGEHAVGGHGDVGIVGGAQERDRSAVGLVRKHARLLGDSAHQRRRFHRTDQGLDHSLHVIPPRPRVGSRPATVSLRHGA